jgi:hypothetical protein
MDFLNQQDFNPILRMFSQTIHFPPAENADRFGACGYQMRTGA